MSLVIIVWTDTREDIDDIKKELLVIDIATGIVLHCGICVHHGHPSVLALCIRCQ